METFARKHDTELAKRISLSGLKRGHIAERAGISRAHLYDLEQGKDPKLDVARRLAAVLEHSIDELWPQAVEVEANA